MGWGDELMAAGHAHRAHRISGLPVAILDMHGRPRSHELWQGLPFISEVRRKGVDTVTNGVGCRPYIQYPFTSAGHGYTSWRARDHRPIVSETLVPRRSGQGEYILIEPTIKAQANQNKRWSGWQHVVDALPHERWLQCIPPGKGMLKSMLRGVSVAETPTFVDAMRRLAGAKLYVGPEGGMHHAAAALGIKAVVIFGGSPSIEATGYPDHINFGTDRPCGRWAPCAHCAEIMRAITPDRVVAAVKEALQ